MLKQKFKYLDILTFKKISSIFVGNYNTSFLGAGMEFEDIRMYDFGDDVKNIDWLSTAKHNRVFIKNYREDRELPAMFLFNFGGSMQFGFSKRTKIETASEAFLLLALSSLKNGDSIGSIFYNQELFEYFEGSKGQLNLWKMIKKLEYFKNNNIDIPANISETLRFLFSKKIKNNIIFIFSDELVVENLIHLKALCSKNDVIFIHISDSFENNLDGKGDLSFSSLGSLFSLNIGNNSKKTVFLNSRANSIKELRHTILNSGGSFLCLNDESNVFKDFYNFFKLRQKII